MSSRSYWVGIPAGVTVHDDGSIEIDVDLSEVTKEMSESFDEDNDEGTTEKQMLMDSAIIDSHVQRRGNRFNQPIPRQYLGLMKCPVRYSCPFETSQLHEMAAHIGDESEKHGAE